MPAHRGIRGASRLKVLVVASQKGGSGKTTLAGHLAVQAELSGEGPVGLIDVDPQGSLADWWNERAAPNTFFIQTTVPHKRQRVVEGKSVSDRVVFGGGRIINKKKDKNNK